MDLAKLIDKDNPNIIEIGCNDGTDTFKFFDVFKVPNIVAFEVDPFAINRFCTKLYSNEFYKEHVELLETAISNIDGWIPFHFANNTLSGSIKNPKLHLEVYPNVEFDETHLVQSIRLDSFYIDDCIIDLVWMDVQGAEDLVIEGGKDTFRNKVRYIYTEFSNMEVYENAPNLQKILNILKNYGCDYELVEIPWQWMAEGNALLKNKLFE